MQPLSNFETAAYDKINNPLTTDNLSSSLFDFIRDEFNSSRSEGSSLIQDDVPMAFRGDSDFEIVDGGVGESLTKKGNSVYKELESRNQPSRIQDANSRVNDEMPSSGKPPGTTGESLGRGAYGEQRASAANNRKNGVLQEMPSKAAPAGTKAEEQLMGRGATGEHRSSEADNRKYELDEMPSIGKPAGAFDEGRLSGGASYDKGSSEVGNRRYDTTDEMPSSGKPAGAWGERKLEGSAHGDQRSSEGNNRKNDATKEAPSSGKPEGAVPESKLKAQDPNHKSSDADPAERNRGVEVESLRNKDGKPETLGEYGYM